MDDTQDDAVESWRDPLCNFQDVGKGPFSERPKGAPTDPISENQNNAQVVLRNFIAAARWGLPDYMIAAMLEDEARTLRGK